MKSKSIKYIPLTELTAFIILTIFIFVIANHFDKHIWIPLLFAIISYFIFLGGTNIILLTEDKIQIIFLNLIGGQASVKLSKITKIWTTETYAQETTIDFESSFYIFKRNYKIEYTDDKNKKRILNFRISNSKKEVQIMNAINRQKQKTSHH